MNKIEFIPDTEQMEFESSDYLKTNYWYAEILMGTTGLLPFQFPALLQGEDFYLQKLTIDDFSQIYSFANTLLLDNLHKKTQYFENYFFANALEKGYYRLKAGGYISKNLIQVKFIDDNLFPKHFNIVDFNDDEIVDFDGAEIVEPY